MLKHGAFRARRWEDDGGVHRDHCADAGRGFFGEVGIAEERGQAVVRRSFRTAAPLADDAAARPLPEVW